MTAAPEPLTRGSWRSRVIDAGLVAGITAFTVLGSGSKPWTGMNSPDSEFSASLVLFGSEVTERAIEPAYYWTRLGFLAPMRGLTGLVGFWTAWEVWRGLLLLVSVAAVYWIARRRTGRLVATAAGLVVALNTMLLGYLGNPYATGTAMAATFLLLAAAIATLPRPGHQPQLVGPAWLPAAMAGGLVAWLVMTNPYAALLGLTLWIGVRVVALAASSSRRWAAVARDAVAAVFGSAVVFIAFLVAGLAMFPTENWFATYRDWNSRLDYASFISDPTIWTKDAAFLVILVAVMVAGICMLSRRTAFTAAALTIAVLNVAFALGYMQLIPGPWLEAPHYSAMLWPAALTAIAMGTAAVAGESPAPKAVWLLLIPQALVLIWAGHRGDTLEPRQAWSIAIAAAVVTIAAVVAARAKPSFAQTAAIVALVLVGAGAQLLQNGRGWLGIYGQYPMNAAYVDYDAEMLMRSKVQAEEFVLANTRPDDRIGIWTDSERLTAAVAAMQLWGIYNNVSANPVLDRAEINGLERLRPTVIAMYAPDRDQIDRFASSLPPWSRPEPAQCTEVPYVGIGSPEAHVCLVRLRWIG